jgi:hypothetical protein
MFFIGGFNLRRNNLFTIAMLAMAFMVITMPAFANLVPTTFGFPVIVQNGSTSAFNQDTARATDFENINIMFPPYFDGVALGASTLGLGVGVGVGGADDPLGVGVTDGIAAGLGIGDDLGLGVAAKATANVLPFGPVNLAFPDICQTVVQTQDVTHTDFAQTNEYAEFAYPFVGVGGVSLPGFGFGF